MGTREVVDGLEVSMGVDWEQMARWDRDHYLHSTRTAAELEQNWNGVAYQEGHYLHMVDGRRLLDFQSQLASTNLGHRHPRVCDALRDALERYGQVSYSFSTDYRARAAKLIVEDVFGPDDWAGRVRLLGSGTDAVLVVLTMARIFTGRKVILTQNNSFHGLTPDVGTVLASFHGQVASGSENGVVREIGGFPPDGFVGIPGAEPDDFDATGGLPSLAALERTINDVGAENVAAVLTETMTAVAGIMSHDDYHRGVRALCDEYGILWILDDVVCGFGRLGEWATYQLYEDLTPDLLTIGKGLNGGLLPVGGIVANREISEFFERDRWMSGSSWDGHPLVAATVVANIETMLEEGIMERAEETGRYLRERLDALGARHGTVGRIGGRGMYHTVDLVDADGNPIEPADRAFDYTGDLTLIPARVIEREAGKLGVYLAGYLPNTIKVAPPLTVSRAEVDKGMEAFDVALDELDRLYL